MITQEQLDEAILTITGRPEWDIVASFLTHEALVVRDACADADTWEQVKHGRGFADGLAYVVNLRDATIRAMNERAADADV